MAGVLPECGALKEFSVDIGSHGDTALLLFVAASEVCVSEMRDYSMLWPEVIHAENMGNLLAGMNFHHARLLIV